MNVHKCLLVFIYQNQDTYGYVLKEDTMEEKI